MRLFTCSLGLRRIVDGMGLICRVYFQAWSERELIGGVGQGKRGVGRV